MLISQNYKPKTSGRIILKKSNKIIINCVQSGSIAEEAGIEKGDTLISINGEKIIDIFDYRFLIENTSLLLEIQKPDGEIWEIEIDKDEDEDLGMEFESSMLDEASSCTNKCIFCFIDQLPGGMRDTLYFKDDDSRLSFLMGNYITLTNMDYDDIDRIIKYRMSPINVSVHTTNPDLRVFMLKNRFAGDVMEKIRRLVGAGINVNCQIVLCRGINDGDELDRSISDMGELYPGISSVSVVPVGITKHREGLSDLKPFDKESCSAVVAQVENWQKIFKDKYDTRIVYLADEFYIMSGIQIPNYEDYEDFPQIENGVGLIALLKQEIFEYLDRVQSSIGKEALSRSISIATGVSAYGFIKEMAGVIETRFTGININVYEIKNNFFGENVTVVGLLTGEDLVSQLVGKELGEELLISRSMLKASENLLLDDYTVEMLAQKLKVKVIPVDNNGKDFVEKIVGVDI